MKTAMELAVDFDRLLGRRDPTPLAKIIRARDAEHAEEADRLRGDRDSLAAANANLASIAEKATLDLGAAEAALAQARAALVNLILNWPYSPTDEDEDRCAAFNAARLALSAAPAPEKCP